MHGIDGNTQQIAGLWSAVLNGYSAVALGDAGVSVSACARLGGMR
jgi:hypothetical protein